MIQTFRSGPSLVDKFVRRKILVPSGSCKTAARPVVSYSWLIKVPVASVRMDAFWDGETRGADWLGTGSEDSVEVLEETNGKASLIVVLVTRRHG